MSDALEVNIDAAIAEAFARQARGRKDVPPAAVEVTETDCDAAIASAFGRRHKSVEMTEAEAWGIVTNPQKFDLQNRPVVTETRLAQARQVLGLTEEKR